MHARSRPRETEEGSRSHRRGPVQNSVQQVVEGASGQGSSGTQGSFLARGREWFRRKSDKSGRTGHAVGESSCLSVSRALAGSQLTQDCVAVPKTRNISDSAQRPCMSCEEDNIQWCSDRSKFRWLAVARDEVCRRYVADMHCRHAVRATRAAHAVAEAPENSSSPSPLTTSANTDLAPSHLASSWSNASATFCTDAAAADVETPKCGSWGGNKSLFTMAPVTASSVPSSPAKAINCTMHAPHASLSQTSPENLGGRSGLWALRSPQGSCMSSSSPEQFDPGAPNRIPNPMSPNILVRKPSANNSQSGSASGKRNSQIGDPASPAQSVSIQREPTGSSTGSCIVSGVNRGCSIGPVDAPSKLLSMGFASSNMSGTEWSHGSPSLAAELVYTFNPGSHLGSETRDAEASLEGSPTNMPFMSTTGELPTPTSNLLGETDTLCSIDGGTRMPVATASPTFSPPAAPYEHITSVHESHALHAQSNSSPLVALLAPSAARETHDAHAWESSQKKRTWQGDLRACTIPHDALPPARSTELSLQGDFGTNAYHSSTSNTLSQSLASPLQQVVSSGTVSMSLSIAPMSTIASTTVSGEFSSSVRGSPQKPPLSPHVRAQYASAARMHVANQSTAIARRARGGASTPAANSQLVMLVGATSNTHTPQPGISLRRASQSDQHGFGRTMVSMRGHKRRISVRRYSDRDANVSRGGLLPPKHEEDEDAAVSCDGSMQSAAAYGPERPHSGGSNYRMSNPGESILSDPSQPMGSKRATDESGCGTTPNSSATLGYMSGYKGAMGTISAPDSAARGSGGESDTGVHTVFGSNCPNQLNLSVLVF